MTIGTDFSRIYGLNPNFEDESPFPISMGKGRGWGKMNMSAAQLMLRGGGRAA